MKFKIQIVLDDEQGQTQIEEVLQLEKQRFGLLCGRITARIKTIIKKITTKLFYIRRGIHSFTPSLPLLSQTTPNKGYHSIQFKTLFGTVVIPSLRLYQCGCSGVPTKTFSLLGSWLPEHISPELQYIETKWASSMSFNKTSELLSDVLPISATYNGVTVRRHLHKIAKRQESELEDKPKCISGCANEWARLPKPDKPITVGIDGGYVRSCTDKRSNFEVVIGKSFSKQAHKTIWICSNTG